jgi:hypothetical protein
MPDRREAACVVAGDLAVDGNGFSRFAILVETDSMIGF